MASKLASLSFKFSWQLTIVVLLLLPLFISLGFWQLYRAQEKRLLQAKFDAHQKIPPLSLEQAARLTDAGYYPVQIEGRFDNTHTFLLDNQFNAHTLGYQVITPLILSNEQRVILINRGWIPRKRDRLAHSLPFIPGKIHINGLLYIPHKNPLISNALETLAWPQLVLALDMTLISQRLGNTVYPWVVLLNAKSPYGFVRHWQPVNMKASMHTGYAFQWFSMAGALCIIYFGMSIKR